MSKAPDVPVIWGGCGCNGSEAVAAGRLHCHQGAGMPNPHIQRSTGALGAKLLHQHQGSHVAAVVALEALWLRLRGVLRSN